jgi:hypothetical protein
MKVESELVKKGEEVYQRRKEEWEQLYLNKIIAIEVEKEELAGAGESIDEASEEALKKYPGKLFYFRRAGPCAATTRLF